MDFENLILGALKKGDMTIQDVATALEINRITAAKYLLALEARKLVVFRRVGRAKLYTVKK